MSVWNGNGMVAAFRWTLEWEICTKQGFYEKKKYIYIFLNRLKKNTFFLTIM